MVVVVIARARQCPKDVAQALFVSFAAGGGLKVDSIY